MTSLAFIFGCAPLWFASGAGSVARRIMGTTVIGGMLAASVIAIFFIPAIFYFVEKVSGAKRRHLPEAPAPANGPPAEGE
jgi:HAE1 family hydrophobic/amphiphilic exporter-1